MFTPPPREDTPEPAAWSSGRGFVGRHTGALYVASRVSFFLLISVLLLLASGVADAAPPQSSSSARASHWVRPAKPAAGGVEPLMSLAADFEAETRRAPYPAIPDEMNGVALSKFGLETPACSIAQSARERCEFRALSRGIPQLNLSKELLEYRDFPRGFNQTRHVLSALYRMGNSVINASVFELTEPAQDTADIRAEIAPAWVAGRPAARLKVSF